MKQTIQKSLTGESRVSKVEPIPVKEIIWLPIRYLLSGINFQRSLFISSFLTYGVGDGVTAVYMMEKTGVVREINPIARFMYANSGKQGVITLKIWFALVILFMVWIISRRTSAYWTINGFLFSLTLGGGMAVRANTMAALGMAPPSPSYVIATFLVIVIISVLTGDLLDKLHAHGFRH